MVNKLLPVLLVLGSFASYANPNLKEIFLGCAQDGKNFFIVEDFPFNISGKIDNGAMGLCISGPASGCSKNFNMSEAFLKNLSLSNGILDIPESQKAHYSIASYEVEVSSKPTLVDDSLMKISVGTRMKYDDIFMDAEKQNFVLENTSLKIEFNHSDDPKSNRFDFSEAPQELKSFSHSVFQIIGVEKNDGLGGSGGAHGTGFFISKSGLALTNLHVMETNSECLSRRSCEMVIKQKDDMIREYKVKTRVLTCSKLNDFCLIKINLSSDMKIKPLEMGLSSISKKLLTLGFPADKQKDFIAENDETVNEVGLTYALGSPIGFSGTGISSSMFIYGGASGSPIIDLEDGSVIGLNSNGAQTFAMGKDGMPAIFRSLYLINKEFDLKGYLSGEKPARIELLIRKLRNSQELQEAEEILTLIEKEKSFYGRGKLEVLSYDHSLPSVRKLILKFVKEQQITTM